MYKIMAYESLVRHMYTTKTYKIGKCFAIYVLLSWL